MNTKKILLVEEKTSISNTNEAALIDFGYEVINTCYGGTTVDTVLLDLPIDLALLDIDAGRVEDGIHLAQDILQKRRLPILFMASHFEPEAAAKMQAVSDYGCLPKNGGDFALRSSLEMAFELFEMRKKRWESENRFRTLAELTPEGIFSTDEHGNYTYANQAWCKLFAIQLKDALGKPWTSLIDPKDRNRVGTEWTAGIRMDKPFEIKFSFGRDEKATRVVCRILAEEGENGRTTGYLGVVSDISRQHDFENTDQLSGEVYQALTNYNLDAIVLVTTSGTVLKANPAACRMFASTENELLGCDMAGLADPRQAFQNVLHQAQVQNGPFTAKLTLVRRDGSKFDGEVTCVIQLTGEENANIFIRDITQSKQVQRELHDSEEHLIQIASVLRVAIWIRDVSTRKVLYVNPAFEELFGMSREAFYEDPDLFYNAIHPEDKKWLRKGEIGRSQEHRIFRPDGSIRWVWGRNFPVRNEAGVIYRSATIVEDITDRKRAEEERRIAYEKVQAQVKEIQSLQSTLSDQAIRDSLTGLFNRRYLIDNLEKVLLNAGREAHSVNLVMIDIDNFKLINDTFGHRAGDLVLQMLAQHLKEYARTRDIICRYGGDEFILVLPEIRPDAVFQRIDKLRRTFQQLKVNNNGMGIQTTLSIGIAVFPAQGQTTQELLTAADQAMYMAKRGGKNSVILLGKE